MGVGLTLILLLALETPFPPTGLLHPNIIWEEVPSLPVNWDAVFGWYPQESCPFLKGREVNGEQVDRGSREGNWEEKLRSVYHIWEKKIFLKITKDSYIYTDKGSWFIVFLSQNALVAFNIRIIFASKIVCRNDGSEVKSTFLFLQRTRYFGFQNPHQPAHNCRYPQFWQIYHHLLASQAPAHTRRCIHFKKLKIFSIFS